MSAGVLPGVFENDCPHHHYCPQHDSSDSSDGSDDDEIIKNDWENEEKIWWYGKVSDIFCNILGFYIGTNIKIQP